MGPGQRRSHLDETGARRRSSSKQLKTNMALFTTSGLSVSGAMADEVLGALGKGGMGEVWRARATKLDREVALKTLRDIFLDDPRRRSRFEHEAKICPADGRA